MKILFLLLIGTVGAVSINFSEKYVPGPCSPTTTGLICTNSRAASQEILRTLWNKRSGVDLALLGKLTGLLRSKSGSKSGNVTILFDSCECGNDVNVTVHQQGNFLDLLSHMEIALRSADTLLGEEELFIYSDGYVRSEPVPVSPMRQIQSDCSCFETPKELPPVEEPVSVKKEEPVLKSPVIAQDVVSAVQRVFFM
jgi:hypothetical protein